MPAVFYQIVSVETACADPRVMLRITWPEAESLAEGIVPDRVRAECRIATTADINGCIREAEKAVQRA